MELPGGQNRQPLVVVLLTRKRLLGAHLPSVVTIAPSLQRGRGCPDGEALDVPGVSRVHTELVWDPPWSVNRMTKAAELQLGLLWSYSPNFSKEFRSLKAWISRATIPCSPR